MKQLQRATRGMRRICFIDLEATQLVSDMIELGAVLYQLDESWNLQRKVGELRVYVKPSHPVGPVIYRLTGIGDRLLQSKGIPYAEALEKLKKLVGKKASETIYCAFGSNDIRIFEQSYSFHNDADIHFIRLIKKNYLDFSAFYGRYIKDEHGNPYSLSNALKMLDEEYDGNKHDALDDAKNLARLYEAFVTKKDKVLELYAITMEKSHHLPNPIRRIVQDIYQKGSASKDDLLNYLREEIA